MIFEFIATITAAFGMAGIALIITHLLGLMGVQAPKWLIPVFAAIGIFAFQIYQEYHWFAQKSGQLPQGVKVVKTIEVTAWYRPWSYFKPQIARFMAVDLAQAKTHADNPNIKLVNLYLFERRMSVKRVPQLIDCQAHKIADYQYPQLPNPTLSNQNLAHRQSNPAQHSASDNKPNIPLTHNADKPASKNIKSYKWTSLDKDDALMTTVCQ